jgi:hypothetical protein
VLAIVAGLIHFYVAPAHFDEAIEFGTFMVVVVVGLAQILAGVLLLVRPSRAVILATVLGTLAVFGIFLVAYTVGLPFGPTPGQPEELRPSAVVSKLVELGLLVLLVWLARDLRRVPSAGPIPLRA